MVSAEWLSQWKSFISNKVKQGQADTIRMSENPAVGVLPPGPISNHTLFASIKESSSELKSDLQLNTDYRGVNREVWQIFQSLYGGGPTIVRESLDIYSKDLSLELSRSKNIAERQKKSLHNI